MKRSFFFLLLALLLFTITLFLESHPWSWPSKRSLLLWLTKKTGNPLAEVITVILPVAEQRGGDLSSSSAQDLALALRAVLRLEPTSIIIDLPKEDYSTTPLSLLREAYSKGNVHGIPVLFDTSLTVISKQPDALSLLPSTTGKTIALEDLLLRSEERERGNIKPEFEMLFAKKIILITRAHDSSRGAFLENLEQRKTLKPLPNFVALLSFLSLLLVFFVLERFSGIDFLLLLFLSMLCYVLSFVLFFHFFGFFLPLLFPIMLLLFLFFGKKSPSISL